MVYDDSLSTSSLIIIVKLTKRRKKHHYKLLISLNSILFPGTMYCFWSLSKWFNDKSKTHEVDPCVRTRKSEKEV